MPQQNDGWRYGKKPKDWSIKDKADFYGELKMIGRERGYKEGWSAMQYRERLGVWPNDPGIRFAEPLRPTRDTLGWLKSRQIAWVKARGNERRRFA
jgi:hypothetical protein